MDIPYGIHIMRHLEGLFPRMMLLESHSQTYSLGISLAEPANGLFFSMKSDEYSLAAGIANSRLFLERNGFQTSLPLAPASNDKSKKLGIEKPCHLLFSWSPTLLRTFVNGIRDAIETPPTLPPNSLLEWARRQAIIPQTTYASRREFSDVVLNGLYGLGDKIQSSRMESSFWDFVYKGARVVRRTPKKEPQIHPTIHGLLHDLAIAKNLQIYPEAASGAGRLDFLVTASLDNGITAKACIEFKNAHSADVEHGLITQLPQYMRTHGTEVGFYCVPWFRGRYFDLPAKDRKDFRTMLISTKSKAGLQQVGLVIIDVSGGSPPSMIRP